MDKKTRDATNLHEVASAAFTRIARFWRLKLIHLFDLLDNFAGFSTLTTVGIFDGYVTAYVRAPSQSALSTLVERLYKEKKRFEGYVLTLETFDGPTKIHEQVVDSKMRKSCIFNGLPSKSMGEQFYRSCHTRIGITYPAPDWLCNQWIDAIQTSSDLPRFTSEEGPVFIPGIYAAAFFEDFKADTHALGMRAAYAKGWPYLEGYKREIFSNNRKAYDVANIAWDTATDAQ